MLEPTLEQTVAAAREFVFRRCPAARVRALFEGGFPLSGSAGASIPASARAGYCLLVTGGVLRAYVSSPDGRQTTSGYLRRGDLLCPLARDLPEVGVSPLVDTAGWVTPIEQVRVNVETYADLGAALAEYSVSILYAAVEQLRFASFATVRQRVVRHLCELSAAADGQSVALSTRTQEIADAVGTVREVVSRTLRELERAGLIRCKSHGVVVRAPSELLREIRDLAPSRLTKALATASGSAAGGLLGAQAVAAGG